MDRYEFWERAHRLMAMAYRGAAAHEDALAEAAKATKAMRAFDSAMQASVDRDVATHPDLVELNVQFDGYYGGKP